MGKGVLLCAISTAIVANACILAEHVGFRVMATCDVWIAEESLSDRFLMQMISCFI